MELLSINDNNQETGRLIYRRSEQAHSCKFTIL